MTTKRQEAARKRAVEAVHNYERKRRAFQEAMQHAAAEAREKVAAALVGWSKLAEQTDRELAAWAEAFGYDPTVASHEEKGLDPDPMLSNEFENFSERLEESLLPDEVLHDILAEETSPFPSEPDDWTPEDAIAVIEQTEPWSEPED